jgi:hypothetical protein
MKVSRQVIIKLDERIQDLLEELEKKVLGNSESKRAAPILTPAEKACQNFFDLTLAPTCDNKDSTAANVKFIQDACRELDIFNQEALHYITEEIEKSLLENTQTVANRFLRIKA